jgi:hypothetical protein
MMVISNFIKICQAVLELKHPLFLSRANRLPQLRQFDVFSHHQIPNSIRERLKMDQCGIKDGGKSYACLPSARRYLSVTAHKMCTGLPN